MTQQDTRLIMISSLCQSNTSIIPSKMQYIFELLDFIPSVLHIDRIGAY